MKQKKVLIQSVIAAIVWGIASYFFAIYFERKITLLTSILSALVFFIIYYTLRRSKIKNDE